MSRFATLLQYVQAEIARRDAAPAGVLSPSDYWKDANRYSSYVRTLPDDELRFIRNHTWHLTGDRYDYYQFVNRRLRERMVAQYEATLPALQGFRPHEPPDGIGFESPYGVLNSGILRYAVVTGDLLAAKLLSRERASKVLEIGGGYGGLALMLLQFNPRLAYVICDLEESLFFQGVFLGRHLGAERVKTGRPAALEPGTVYLVPQGRAGELAGLDFDFTINQQSMQEMTLAQVEHYCELLAGCSDRFYSCNRRSHGAGIVRDKGLVPDLHQALAARFPVEWDSTDHVAPLARVCLRHKLVRKLVTAFIGSSFLPAGEAGLRRFVYRCR